MYLKDNCVKWLTFPHVPVARHRAALARRVAHPARRQAHQAHAFKGHK